MASLYSAKILRTARGMKLKPADLAFADLVAAGWSLGDAWAAVIGQGATWPPAQLKREQEEKYNQPAVLARVEKTRNLMSKTQVSRAVEKKSAKEKRDDKAVLARAMSKEQMLLDLYRIRESMVPGSPEYIKVNQQIIDVAAMKKEDIKTEDNTVHFYLPKKCYDCAYRNGGDGGSRGNEG